MNLAWTCSIRPFYGRHMDVVRLGIIGVGNMGAAHARNLLAGNIKGLKLTALADKDPARLKPFPSVTGYTEPEQLIASPEVDAVLVATPHFDHPPLGIATLQAGKHLLMEKPIAVHKADAERLLAAHTDSKLVFSAMFNQRTDPHFVRLRQLLQSGELGQLRRLSWVITDWFRSHAYYASGGWRATWSGEGGGVLLNQSPHQLDLWQWLFGMPQRVRAFCQLGRYHDIEVEDDVTAYFEYDSGCTATFITSTGEAPGTNRLEIACDRGRLVYDPSLSEDLLWTRTEMPVEQFSRTTKGGFTRPPTWDVRLSVKDGKGPQHTGILQNFADAILKGTPLIAPAAEGLASVELANAMLLSAFEGRTVSLPLDGTAYETVLKKKIASSRGPKGFSTSTPMADFR